ncbi:MAG: hydrogenase maturation nickel metallochaperone HypA [Kiritimatiellae bacterium]|nr:hydrogenase maturation nickel metallochaperone HypA [Kiritimatiellia bacterium]
MHELSIARALVDQVVGVIRTHGAIRATMVRVQLGTFSGVVKEALETAFPFAAEGTAAEGARLEIEEVPARVVCHNCGKTSQPDFPFLFCAECGKGDVELVAGRELLLTAVELIGRPGP